MVQWKSVAAAAILAATLAGCGTTTGDRVVSGAGIGAAGGAVIGAMTGSPGTGAALGALAGGAIGGLTDPCDLDLGAPYWRDHGGASEYDRRCGEGDHDRDRDRDSARDRDQNRD